MAAARTQRHPTFFWQGVFIMLPVMLLVVVSLISLRQDEQTAEADAHQRAEENVISLAHAIHNTVNDELQRFLTLQKGWITDLYSASQPSVSTVFPDDKLIAEIKKWDQDYPGLNLTNLAVPTGEILTDGRLIRPPGLPAVPAPPKWFRDLSPEQKDLWETGCRATDPTKIRDCRQRFLDTKPSPEAQRAAFFQFTLINDAAFDSGTFPTETGIPFQTIACCRLLSVSNAQLTAPLLQSVWWQSIDHPSIISPKLFTLVAALINRSSITLQQKFIWMQQYWHGQSQAREWLASLREPSELTNHWQLSSFWSHWAERSQSEALAFFEPATFKNAGTDEEDAALSGDGYFVWLVPRSVVNAIFEQARAQNQFLVPEYVRIGLTVEGQPIRTADDPKLTETQPLLASTTQTFGSRMTPSSAHFDLKFYLTSRSQMLAAQRHRSRLFIGLILGTAFTALAGLLAAWRAFHRQRQLNELKSNFVSSVSHELRAPIASVRLMAENLESGKVSASARQGEYFRFIRQECRRLSSLIENVLDFSRIEQGRKQYEFEPTDLAALTRNTILLMEPYAAEKDVALQSEIATICKRLDAVPQIEKKSETPHVVSYELNVDGRAIQQALINLIDNAIKHSTKEQTVKVQLEHSETLPAIVKLSVSDQGPGIPTAEQQKIFERFYRLGSELRRETQGIGIGLNIAKNIIEAHDGWLTVESEPGKGSRFTIELPFTQQKQTKKTKDRS